MEMKPGFKKQTIQTLFFVPPGTAALGGGAGCFLYLAVMQGFVWDGDLSGIVAYGATGLGAVVGAGLGLFAWLRLTSPPDAADSRNGSSVVP